MDPIKPVLLVRGFMEEVKQKFSAAEYFRIKSLQRMGEK